MDTLLYYFPQLSDIQVQQFARLKEIYQVWNQQINVISRKDFENFYLHHVLHSLAIAKTNLLREGMQVLDVGTGGGFPGIPLAIYYPSVSFYLVDSIGKKIRVVNEVIAALGLTNARAEKTRAEDVPSSFDAVVSRAVTTLPEFVPWVRGKFNNNASRPGILYLKGGDMAAELKQLPYPVTEYSISDWYAEPWFETKKVVRVLI